MSLRGMAPAFSPFVTSPAPKSGYDPGDPLKRRSVRDSLPRMANPWATTADVLGNPPAFNPNAIDAAGKHAGLMQRKKAKGYSLLMDGPKSTVPNPGERLVRQSLLGY